MDIKAYFESSSGTGILSTSSGAGIVNSALYARPHVLSDGHVSFIMADRLSRKNLQENPSAAYLFIEAADGYHGTRLHLTKVAEQHDDALIQQLSRRTYSPEDQAKVGQRALVHFRVDAQLPLVGAEPAS